MKKVQKKEAQKTDNTQRRTTLSGHIFHITATFLYAGHLPLAPATFATLIGVALYLLLSPLPLFYYSLLAVFIVAGIFSADYYEKNINPGGEKNPRAVVIDEVIGFMVTMATFTFDPADLLGSIKFIVLGFLIFRIFDTWKPYPVEHIGNLEGGPGIVLDDIMAGVYANLLLQFIRWQPYGPVM